MLCTYNNFSPDIHSSAFIAPTAVLIGHIFIGESSSIWFNCVVRGDLNQIKIGSHANIQDGCLMHVTNSHPLIVGDRVTVGHGAILHGCTIESDCLIAMGAVILDGAIIKSGSIVAAGAVVAPGSEIPAGSIVMGVPGKVIRSVTPSDSRKVEKGWQNYVGYSDIYRQIPEMNNI